MDRRGRSESWKSGGFLLSTPTPEHPKVRMLDGCELPEKVSPGCLLSFSTWGWLDKGLQEDGGAGRHSSRWHWDSGYHHRFGLQWWLPGGQGFAWRKVKEKKEGMSGQQASGQGPQVSGDSLPEEPSEDRPMLIWTAPGGGPGTSRRRHP